MAKAVLVVELRENCEDCDLFEANFMTHFVPYCYKANRMTKWKGRPGWCPLIPEPPQATPDNSDMSVEWNMGWNACLDALEGKENE